MFNLKKSFASRQILTFLGPSWVTQKSSQRDLLKTNWYFIGFFLYKRRSLTLFLQFFVWFKCYIDWFMARGLICPKPTLYWLNGWSRNSQWSQIRSVCIRVHNEDFLSHWTGLYISSTNMYKCVLMPEGSDFFPRHKYRVKQGFRKNIYAIFMCSGYLKSGHVLFWTIYRQTWLFHLTFSL